MFTNIAAQTLPRMTTTAPSVSVEPPSSNENIPDSRDNRRDSQGSRGKDRQSREMKEIPIRVEGYTEVNVNKAPRASEENVDIESSRESIDGIEKHGARPKTAESQRPKLREISRQSSKEVYRYTEVEQRQTVLEQEPVVTHARQTVMPVQIVTTVHDEHGVARKGSDDQPLHHYLSPHHTTKPSYNTIGFCQRLLLTFHHLCIQ